MSNKVTKDSRKSRSRSPIKSKVKSKRLLVANIPFNVSLKELKDIFKKKIGICGKLDYIEKNGKFTGNAVMEFKTIDGAQKAVAEMHKYSLNGREIIVREETNRDRDRLSLNQPQNNIPPISQSQGSIYQLINDLEKDGPITNSLFIANLDYTLTWQKLKDMFKEAGRVRHVDIKTDSEGKSRGFGTVEFESPEEAVVAIHLFNKRMLNNREIKLRMDKSGKTASGGLDMSRFTNLDQISQNNSLNPQIRRVLEDILSSITNPNRNNPQALKALNELLSLAQIMEKGQLQQFNMSENMLLKSNFDRNPGYGSNPNSRNWNDMGHSNINPDNMFFNQNYDNPYYRNQLPDKGFGSSPEFPNRMISRDYPPDSPRDMRYSVGSNSNSQNQESGNRELLLIEEILHKLKSSDNVDQFGVLNILSSVINKRNDQPHPGVNQLHSNSSRMSNDFLSDNSSNALLIKNIPFSYTWKDLKHSFSQAHGIVHTEIIRDEFNRSKGMGLVRFATHGDAMRCKNMMDGTLFDGRPIHIEFNK